MQTSIGLNDDYACVYTLGDKPDDRTKLVFYYGYEYELDGEWSFIVTRNNEVLKQYSKPLLQETCDRELNNPEDFLIQGMYLYINGI